MAEIPGSQGAVDFSAFKANPAESNPTDIPDTDAAARVPSLVMEADTQNLNQFLKLSEQIPLLIDLYTLRHEQSADLSQKLAREVISRGGAVVLLRIDADKNPQLAQAFQVQQLPSVLAILRSQPVPLFSGDQTAESIALVVDKVLEAAAANGVTGSVTADQEGPTEPPLPPLHQAAIEAIESGDYDAAEASYQAALAQAPADALAAAGLAQVQLLKRTAELDYEQVLASSPKDLRACLAKADALASIGEFAASFSAILDRFETELPEREELRAHLLELFKVAGADEAVAPARARLTNLLF